jgi:osmotically-inducible protein OsmY
MTRGAVRAQRRLMSDLSLKRAVQQALADRRLVPADAIAVQARDGEVVLRGTVGSPLQRLEAARTARNVPGVRRVRDQLAARPLGIAGRADADTQAAVLDAFIADDQLHAADIDVSVRDGNVTLRGIVELAALRERATRVALSVAGVSHVTNLLRVWLTVSAEDVAARVTQAVGLGTLTGANEIVVRVSDNDVTLSGHVSAPEHREAALAAAARAPGVAGVHDALTVRPG